MQILPRPLPNQPPSKCSRWLLRWSAKKPDGRWGKDSEIFYGTRHEAEIAGLLREAERAKRPTPEVSPQDLTVGGFWEAWIAEKASHLRPKTLESYTGLAAQHILPELGTVRLRRLTSKKVAEWLAGLSVKERRYGGVLSARTAGYCRSLLADCLHEAVRQGLITSNPVSLVRAPVQRPHIVPSYSLDEIRRLDAITHEYQSGILIAILWRTGIRLGEALALRWSDVKVEQGTISITKQLVEVGGKKLETPPKSARGVREIPIPDEALALLVAHKEAQDAEREARFPTWNSEGFVFCTERGTQARHRNTIRAWHTIRDRAGLKPAGVHALRHTFASLSLQAGMDLAILSALLGHENPAFTARIYAHVLTATKRQAVNLVNVLLKDG